MKKFGVLFILTAVAFGTAFGQEKKMTEEKKPAKAESKAMESASWEGYLADAKCGSKMAGDKGEAKAKRHTVDCALMDDCKASGYGLVTGGKYVKFTKDADTKAVAFLEKAEMESDIYVKVTGKMEGEQLVVTSIEAAKHMEKMEKKEEKKMENM
ncbi:MAG: hypothetical protein A2X67_10525 [Ignavibacteria bacterium GWA2_55_11]|nr:MAG: hypothetical protein A2X67_10525 [Ignavibacteria bacterium GWA2_55_11]OGU47896.1 MAG: hypothetical protein A2X68_07255 [Ignavibacteria bacterium GWC2_56_12]OGU65111.1 MAG: hypothetical protein A3C56_11565 [Ignavibacteria bacterium RIFCSPHIGHO2_02_FULL_56_12]OGU71717.1 MAG: hypothetical protein A3H45_04335 [Ignavibacteria bacterium RIFCSPLOWO2_02_FULL_55_14]